MRTRTRTRLLAIAAVAGALIGGSGVALAASTATSPTVFTACVRFNVEQHIYNTNHSCPNGQAKYTWNQVGPQGPAGSCRAAGSAGPAGSQRHR